MRLKKKSLLAKEFRVDYDSLIWNAKLLVARPVPWRPSAESCALWYFVHPYVQQNTCGVSWGFKQQTIRKTMRKTIGKIHKENHRKNHKEKPQGKTIRKNHKENPKENQYEPTGRGRDRKKVKRPNECSNPQKKATPKLR